MWTLHIKERKKAECFDGDARPRTGDCCSGVLKLSDAAEAKKRKEYIQIFIVLSTLPLSLHFHVVYPVSCHMQDIFSTFPYLDWHLLHLAFHLCPVQISPSALFIWALAVFRSNPLPFLPTESEGLSTSPSNLTILISNCLELWHLNMTAARILYFSLEGLFL